MSSGPQSADLDVFTTGRHNFYRLRSSVQDFNLDKNLSRRAGHINVCTCNQQHTFVLSQPLIKM